MTPWRRGSALRVGLAVAVVAVVATGCAVLPPPGPRAESHAIRDGATTFLARAVGASASASAAGASGLRVLGGARFALDARIAIARAAEKSLDVQYYLLKDDSVGMRLLVELRAAAARGVRVRLLVDDLTNAGQDEVFAGFAAHPGIEVRLFNPSASRAATPASRLLLSIGEFGRLDHRMHNKLMVADNSVAVAGGRNMADEYFMRSADANFIDIDLLAAGAVVAGLSDAFDRYWNSAQVRPLGEVVRTPRDVGLGRYDGAATRALDASVPADRDALGRTAVGAQLAAGELALTWGRAQVFVDDPGKIERPSADAFRGSVTEAALGVFGSAHAEVDIVSPYFIPNDHGLAVIETAMRRGARIRLVTNSLAATDEPLAYAGYERRRLALLRAGVEIDELAADVPVRSGRFGPFGASTSRLHAKLAVVDKRRLFIGSMNLDHRSAVINTEIAVLVDDDELVRELVSLMRGDRTALGYRLRLADDGVGVRWLETMPDGTTVVHDRTPGEVWWRRLRNFLLLPLVGDSEL